MQQTKPRLTLSRSASYSICVQGFLDKDWSEHFRLNIEYERDAAAHPVTVLSGRLTDQAALFGILDSLYGLGFPLLSVECLAVETTDVRPVSSTPKINLLSFGTISTPK